MNGRNGSEGRARISEIFQSALDRVDPEKMLTKLCSVDGDRLLIRTEESSLSYNIKDFSRIWVIGAGKAGAKMALGIEKLLGDRIDKGLVAVKYGHTEELEGIRLIEAGHPVPDENSCKAAKEISRLCREADKDTLIINLISGGGSAILAAPYEDEHHSLTLDQLQELTSMLLSCGADIREINCLRKHLSLVKGGRLGAMISPATGVSLILSDVLGDSLDTIASGLTVPDAGSFDEAWAILEKYRLEKKLPPQVIDVLRAGKEGRIPDTPKPGDPAFSKLSTVLIGTNIAAIYAAEERAASLGYDTLVLGSRISGEAREIALVYAGIARDGKLGRLRRKKPLCVIAGGETTVTLRGSGKGGRNQEMVSAFLGDFLDSGDDLEGITFLSCGTDGNDGPTDAAGGIADALALARAREGELSPHQYLENSDSYHFLKAIDGLVITGPTNTNVCDIQIILID